MKDKTPDAVVHGGVPAKAELTTREAELKKLSEGIITHVEANNYKGKKASEVALAYLIGADAVTNRFSGPAFLVSIRGYDEIKRWAAL